MLTSPETLLRVLPWSEPEHSKQPCFHKGGSLKCPRLKLIHNSKSPPDSPLRVIDSRPVKNKKSNFDGRHKSIKNYFLNKTLLKSVYSIKRIPLSFSRTFPSLYLTISFSLWLLSLPLPLHSTFRPAFRPHLFFRTLSIEHGLSQNAVLSITRDRTGFMWFGTESGLNRYDGYRFRIYLPVEGNSSSLSNSWVNALLTDHSGRVWIGTENGLNEYNPSTDEFVRYFHHPSDPASLSSSRIFCLFEDRQGRLWVGTDAGLNLFDRSTRKFIRYLLDRSDQPGSLSQPSVRAIAQDAAGFLWVATTGGGLFRLDPRVGFSIQFRHDPQNPASLPDDNLNCLLIDSSSGREIIWLGTTSAGLVRFDPSINEFKTYRRDRPVSASYTLALDSTSLSLTSPPDNTITCLTVDPSGNLWAGTYYGGLAQFSPSRELFVSYRHQAIDPFSLPDNQIRSLYFSPDGILWVGTYRGLAQLNFNRQFLMRFLSDPSDPNTLSNPVVRAFCRHSSGLLFVGTDGGGLNAIDLKKRQEGNSLVRYFKHQPGLTNSPGSDRIFCLLEDIDSTLWIGTLGGGLDNYEPANGKFTHYRYNPRDPYSLPEDNVRSLYLDVRNTLWVGTVNSGLVYFDRTTRNFRRPRISRSVHPSKDFERPAEYRSTSSAQANFADCSEILLSRGRIFKITGDSHGRLWIGAYDQGLLCYDPASGELIHFLHQPHDSNSLSSNSVITVYVDSRNLVWVGTNGGGLNCLDPATLTFTRYNESHGLPSSVIYAILEDDDGFIWISSNRGLSRLDPATRHIRNFDNTDGLQSYEFNGNACLKSPEGYLYFGGINGFNVFNPGEIEESRFLPPVVVTDLYISGQRIKPNQALDGDIILRREIHTHPPFRLTWKHRVVAFEFVALDYTCPEKNQFAYKMEGFDQDWIYSGSRRYVSYSNLPPGRYVFRVKASNCDGFWNEQGVSLTITVIPPFWRTRWFYLLVALFGLSILYGFYRLRINRIKARQLELERLVAQRTEELRQANEKLKFLATTDELTGLANYRRFREYLKYEWRRARRKRKPISLIISDLDNFKLFNDTYGHQAGDECLRRVALAMLHSCQRPSDLVCRYGGDEFAVVLPETDMTGAYLVAERIREAVSAVDLTDLAIKVINEEQNKIDDQGEQSFNLTSCFGVATMNPAEGGSPDELIDAADRALYRAKASGKNRTQFG